MLTSLRFADVAPCAAGKRTKDLLFQRPLSESLEVGYGSFSDSRIWCYQIWRLLQLTVRLAVMAPANDAHLAGIFSFDLHF